MRTCKILVLATVFVSLLVTIGASSLFAGTLKIRISDGTTTKLFEDDGSGDFASVTPGLLSVLDSFLGYSVVFNTATSKPVIGDADLAQLDLASFVKRESNTPGTLTIDVTDTNFAIAPNPSYTLLSLATGFILNGSYTFQSYVNYGAGGNNPFGGIDSVGGLVVTTGLQNPVSPNSDVASLLFNGTDPFSMSSRTVLNFNGSGLASLDNFTTTHAPEPSSIVLLLSGLALSGLGLARRKR